MRILATSLLVLALSAQAQDNTAPAVHVNAFAKVDQLSYRRMHDAAQAYAMYRDFAPQAPLRFQILPPDPDAAMEGLQLRLRGETVSLPIALSPDLTFGMIDDAQALAEDADVMSNLRKGSLEWRIHMVTPGLPPHRVRLGDLRLECKVSVASGLYTRMGALSWVPSLRDNCLGKGARFFTSADVPVFGITLVHAERREVLQSRHFYVGGGDFSKSLGKRIELSYALPLDDDSWPDDTLAEFDAMDAPQPQPAAPTGVMRADQVAARAQRDIAIGQSTRESVRAAFTDLGKPAVTRFPGGREVWVYPIALERGKERRRDAEMVVLFGKDGVAQRHTVRL